MNPQVLTQLAHVDPNAAPLNINELIDILNPVLQSAIIGSYIPYIIQQGAPGVGDQDKAWIELDSAGRPLSTKIFYNGNWRRIYNGMLGEIRMFSGDPTVVTDWDATGHGVVGGTYDGWQICNGKNGAPDLTDKFVIGAHMVDNTGFSDGNWLTKLDGTHLVSTGGAPKGEVTLDAAHTYRPPIHALLYNRINQQGGDTAGEGTMASLQPVTQFVHDIVNDPGNTTPTAITVAPPFIAYGLIIFQGYA